MVKFSSHSLPTSLLQSCLRRLALLAAAGLTLACGVPAVASKPLPSPVISKQHDRLDPALLDATIGGKDGDAYRVGPGDTVLVAVYGHPELSIGTYGGASYGSIGGRNNGLLIDNDGTIQFPLVGTVQVAGKTANELKEYLERQLATYVNEPKVTVQVIYNGSIRYYLLGQFSEPGLKYSDRPLRLLEALALGGSVALERASLRTAYVARGGKRLPIDFRKLVLEGDLRQNIKLRSGDVVLVPDRTSEQAFVFGTAAVGGLVRGGAVPFVNGRLTLLQALAYTGFGYRERAQGRLASTRVIRSVGSHAEFFVVNAEKILSGEAGAFELAPGDVIYIPPTGLTTWSESIQQLLPTLQTVSGLLSPFVQIKYLSE